MGSTGLGAVAVVVCLQLVYADVEDTVSLLGDEEVQAVSLPRQPHDFWCTAGPLGRCSDQTSRQAWKQACFQLEGNKVQNCSPTAGNKLCVRRRMPQVHRRLRDSEGEAAGAGSTHQKLVAPVMQCAP